MNKEKKIKLNMSKRKLATKVFARHYQNEDNILKQAYKSAKLKVDYMYSMAHEKMRGVVESHYPNEDIEGLSIYQKKYDLNIVRPDACFNVRNKTGKTQTNWRGEQEEVFEDTHVDFNLFGSTTGNNYRDYGNHKGNFAFAYYHDYLKQKNLEPSVISLQGDKGDNPYHRELGEKCFNELGGASTSRESMNGFSAEWHDKYKLNVIMRSSYCDSRYLACSNDDWQIFQDFLIAKQNLVQTYNEWQENIIKRIKVVEDTLKKYTYFNDVEALANHQGIEISKHDIEVESTALAIFNPLNVSSMLDDLKPKAKESRDEKIARITALQNSEVANG